MADDLSPDTPKIDFCVHCGKRLVEGDEVIDATLKVGVPDWSDIVHANCFEAWLRSGEARYA